MAHNLEFKNGKYSFAANEPAWHGLGTILDHKMSAAEAMELARLNYIVGITPLQFTVDGILYNDDKRNVTYRTDTNYPLGVVGKKYFITQNYELFSFFDQLVDEGEAIYTTAGVLGNGETVFITAKMDNYFTFKGKEQTDLYIVLMTSHDGSLSTKCIVTPIRVVCNNTLNMALGQNRGILSIKHTENAKERLRNAHKILGLASEYSSAYEELIDSLASVKVNENSKIEIIDSLFPSQGENKTKITNIRINVLEAINTAPGQEDIKDNLYGILNGISYYMGTKSTKSLDTRFRNITGGNFRLKLNRTAKVLQTYNIL